MREILSRYKVLIITMAVLSVIIMTLIYSQLKVEPRLTYFEARNIDKKLVDSTLQFSKQKQRIGDFALINQNKDTVTQEYYKDKIYVADFFFTTCQTICPIMTSNMVDIQRELKNDTIVKLLSHSVIPMQDTPEVLKKYALEKGVDDSKWNLVTGTQEQIFTLARKHYLAVQDIPGTEDDLDMVHTENFMLIDKKGYIRGYYDGTDDKEIERLLEEIDILKAEYEPEKAWYEKIFD
ncbi:SCO family protein [Dokdonia sinensis]|uniref:SCO family protein n=1 Tax=Dokdonia sinensis TaxID=2479847 RepID=A0A3M0GGK7_9FLAO|nr:SCO family protein [Dokdonia sinensis]RMB56456.1 SCO family protein [Dokdonia sinensis]